MNNLQPMDQENLIKLPPIRRNRDYHAYSFNGTRYLDLWRNDGFSLLGYSIPGLQLGLKNRVSHALWGGMPHPLQKQVKKTLARCFPDHHVFICPDRERVRVLLDTFACAFDRVLFPGSVDLALGTEPRTLSFWLPFSGLIHGSSVELALIPIPGTSGPLVVLVPRDYAKEIENIDALDCLAQFVPIHELTSLHISVLALDALGAFAIQPLIGVRTRDMSQKLGVWRESYWETVQLAGWKRTGPYLYHQFSPELYRRVCAYALHNGIILNPSSSGFSILPGIMSDGERKQVERVLAFVPEGDA